MHWVGFVIVCGGHGRVDGLVIGVMGNDEGVDQGREGEEKGEESEDCPGGEDAAGAVGIVLFVAVSGLNGMASRGISDLRSVQTSSGAKL